MVWKGQISARSTGPVDKGDTSKAFKFVSDFEFYQVRLRYTVHRAGRCLIRVRPSWMPAVHDDPNLRPNAKNETRPTRDTLRLETISPDVVYRSLIPEHWHAWHT